jgi:methylmalonyl-CoA mutase N-terminal domain/subunit
MIKVGVNKFRVEEKDRDLEVFRVDSQTLPKQIQRLNGIKALRDNATVLASLSKLKQAAIDKKNLMPYLLEVVKSYATLGEIVNVLKEVYGEAPQMNVF